MMEESAKPFVVEREESKGVNARTVTVLEI